LHAGGIKDSAGWRFFAARRPVISDVVKNND
jgi:hypothetical protein